MSHLEEALERGAEGAGFWVLLIFFWWEEFEKVGRGHLRVQVVGTVRSASHVFCSLLELIQE